MTTLILGQHPGRLDVRLVEGDGADLVGTLIDTAGSAIAWPGTPALEFAGADGPVEATVDGSTATWSLTVEKVAELAAIGRPLMVRLTLPDDGDPDGRVLYAGRVSWSDGWSYGDRTQRVTFTLPGGPPGPKGDPGDGGGASLVVVAGGTVDLDNNLPDGSLVGYKATAPTTIEGRGFTAGIYIFERDSTVFGGWTVHTVATGEVVATPPDTTTPTAGVLTSSAVTETSFTLNVAGASDETALASAPYAFSVDGGVTWSAYQSAASYSVAGRTASTAYQCRHRVRDAAGNVTTGSAITVTTAAADPAPGWTIYDGFTAADGTAVGGRTTVKGGKTWAAAVKGLTMGGAVNPASITGGAVVNGYMGGIQTHEADLDLGSPNAEVSVDYDLSVGTAALAERQCLVAVAAGTSDTDTLAVRVRGDGQMQLYKGGIVQVTLAGVTTGHPQVGTLVVKCLGNAFSATTAAGTATVTLTPGTGWSGTGTRVCIAVREDGSKIDNFKARVAT